MTEEHILYGNETKKALDNFPHSGLPKHLYFYKAYAEVKLACALVNKELGYLEHQIADPLIKALHEMIEGQWFENFITDPIQGGAGTSTNMNINEIAATRATALLDKTGFLVDPLLHVNLHQSTNDTYPTALKIAIYYFLTDLETAINELLQTFQAKEIEFAKVVKIARTQLMPAVPYTLGREFGAFSDVIGRDRWRIFKSMERIRQVNLGGTAIGTGIAAPKKYILSVVDKLREITKLPLAKAENLVDATQNHDQIAEAFGMLKVYAMNLEKIVNDLRLLISYNEIQVPSVQLGSSIMPGKENPVILEMVSMVAKKVMGNELTATLAISGGELELNAFLPLVAITIFESLDLLIQSTRILTHKCIPAIKANDSVCYLNLIHTPASSTLLMPRIDYHKATLVAEFMKKNNLNLKEAVLEKTDISEAELNDLMKPERITSLGYGK